MDNLERIIRVPDKCAMRVITNDVMEFSKYLKEETEMRPEAMLRAFHPINYIYAPVSNVMSAFLVRLNPILGSQFSPHDDFFSKVRDGKDQTIKDFNYLQTCFALSASSNIEDRRGELDPDTYVIELLRAERHWLWAVENFADVIDRVSEYATPNASPQRMLFVQPIVCQGEVTSLHPNKFELRERMWKMSWLIDLMMDSPHIRVLLVFEDKAAEGVWT